MKRFLALALALCLCLTPALAAAVPSVHTYPGYADVKEGDWFADAARVCYETGLITGTDAGFSPTMVLTYAQLAVITARLREALTGEPIPAAQEGESWYGPQVRYLAAIGVTVPSPTANATRRGFVAMLAAVLSQKELTPINSITALPDTADTGVLAFYNAGILTGVDDYGTFNAEGTLTRAEAAAMVARVARPELRKRFTPLEKPAATPADSMALMVNGQKITLGEYVAWLDKVIFQTDVNLYNTYGTRLDWNADYGVGDLSQYFKEQAIGVAVRYVVLSSQAKALGCDITDLAARMTPNPSYEVLSAFAQSQGYLGAKHILIQTYDPRTGQAVHPEADALQTANEIIDVLNNNPTLNQFNSLMDFNEDPGMESYPEGYLFQSGDMVKEFENATRGLEMGAFTKTPVKSTYGYHVIWRVDPATMEECKAAYQDKVLDTLINTWVDEATVTPNNALIEMIDAQQSYNEYLALLLSQQN